LISKEIQGAATAGFQRILKAGGNNIGDAGAHLDTNRNAHAANLGADNGIWKNNKAALHAVTIGNRLILATDAKIITIDDITASNVSKLVKDAVVYKIELDGANGARIYTKDNGILYVKSDGTLDAAKAVGKSKLKTALDVEAGKTSGFTFTDDIIASHVDGKKTYYATGDMGIVVREEKERTKP
jgi:hypothetical protein